MPTLESIEALVARAQAKLAQRHQPETAHGTPAILGATAAAPLKVPKTLADSIALYVGDDDLQRLLARAKAAHDALPPREALVLGTATLCPPDPVRVPGRRDFARPLARAYPRDEQPCDYDFWQGHVRKVPMLQGVTVGQMRRTGAKQKHWRQAMAIVIGKWDGQVQVDRVAMMHKIVPELARTRGPDPRDHPAYRVVHPCERAAAFAGVQDFVGKPA